MSPLPEKSTVEAANQVARLAGTLEQSVKGSKISQHDLAASLVGKGCGDSNVSGDIDKVVFDSR